MINVVIIGAGNVSYHLIEAFSKSAKINVIQVFARRKDAVNSLIKSAEITSNVNQLKEANVYIIAVSDDAINQISAKLPFKNRLVVHTSGSVSIDALDSKNRKGIFYPLQTFTKNESIDFSSIPICLESENVEDLATLQIIAESVSNKVQHINSIQRKALHVSAVFVNNFTNHLYQIGQAICDENKLPFEILKPLILQTANKVLSISPKEAQTGPAKRNDLNTIYTHLHFLSNENHACIYKILTQSIQNNGS